MAQKRVNILYRTQFCFTKLRVTFFLFCVIYLCVAYLFGSVKVYIFSFFFLYY